MSGQLPNWLADWLGVEPGANGDATTWQLDSAWAWPPWATVLLVMAIVAWVVFFYSREASPAGRPYRTMLVCLRTAAITLLLVMLAQWALALRLTGPPSIALMVDRSASMDIADRYDDVAQADALRARLGKLGLAELSRLNLAKLLTTQDDARLVRQLADRYQLAVYFVADGVERLPAGIDAAEVVRAIRTQSTDGSDSQATRLGDAVRHVLDDRHHRAAAAGSTPLAAMVLLTDGTTTAGVPLAEAAAEARQRGVPLWTIGLGSDQLPRDVRLADVLVDDVAFVNDLVSFQVRVDSRGLQGELARVVLRREGQPEPLAEETITLGPAGQSQTIHLLDRPTVVGDLSYVVEVPVRDDETNDENNVQRRVVTVRDEPIRVLLVDGYPRYEFRYLKTLLERDPTIKLGTYLQDADPDYAEQDRSALRTFPVGSNALSAYDVVVFGDVNPRLLPRAVWRDVQSFVVDKGGGVAFLAGSRYLPWVYRDIPEVAALLPVDLSRPDSPPNDQLARDIARGFVVRPTLMGLRFPSMQLGDTPNETEQIWRNLPPLYWLADVGTLKPAAQILAEHPTRSGARGRNLPIICTQFVGAGKVLLHATDSTWRWRIGVGDVYFARYWIQTVRYLARGKLMGARQVELSTDRREYRRGDTVHVRARFFGQRLPAAADTVTVLVEASGQPRDRITLHRNPSVAGVFEGIIGEVADGRYHLLVVDPESSGEPPATQFAVVAPPGEFARPEMDRTALESAAKTTHGRFYTIDDADRLLEELPVGRRVPIENLPPLSIWSRWWLLALFLACIISEWVLRKRKGML